MNAIIGGEKPVVGNVANIPQMSVQGVDNATQPRPIASFIVGYRAENTVVERVLTGDDTNDLDLLVASFVLVLKGAGFEVNLAVNAEGDFVIEDDSEVIEVEVEPEIASRLEVGDRVVVVNDEDDIGLSGKTGKVIVVEPEGYSGFLDVLVKFDDWTYNSGGMSSCWANSSQLKRVTTN